MALTVAACHHRAPEAAPVPALSGEPPQVQAPVGAAPLLDSTAPPTLAAPAPDPRLRRFDVVGVQDTTLTILIGPDRWIHRGTVGIAVDPKRRDAFVARFRVLARVGDSAIALVTGQTTRVDPSQVALIREPTPGLLRQQVFWAGLFLGIAAGAGGLLLIRH